MNKALTGILVLCLLRCSVSSVQAAPPEEVTFGLKAYRQDPTLKQYEQTLFADLNGDGKDEYIWSFRGEPGPRTSGFPRAFTLIYEMNGGKKELVKRVVGNMNPGKLEARDVDGDGKNELIIYTTGGVYNYLNIAICKYKKRSYDVVFEEGSAVSISLEGDGRDTLISVGRVDPKAQAGLSDQQEPLLEVYRWNGKTFQYSAALSTTDYIGEKKAIINAMIAFKGDYVRRLNRGDMVRQSDFDADNVLDNETQIFTQMYCGARTEDFFKLE